MFGKKKKKRRGGGFGKVGASVGKWRGACVCLGGKSQTRNSIIRERTSRAAADAQTTKWRERHGTGGRTHAHRRTNTQTN